MVRPSLRGLQHNVRKLTGRSSGVSIAYRLYRLARYVRGWMKYFRAFALLPTLPELDAWLRRRLRMCFWKQWRSVRTKVRELLKLGTAKPTAILTALSRKGPWHLSRTLATQTGMTNQWLSETLSLVLDSRPVDAFTFHYLPTFVEPPSADPHARWCGGWGGRPPWLPGLGAGV